MMVFVLTVDRSSCAAHLRSPSATVSVTITLDKNRLKHEQVQLGSFRRSLTDFGRLPFVIEEATQEMGLGAAGGIQFRAFSRDVLTVEITGPA
jgi:hypothetical protein